MEVGASIARVVLCRPPLNIIDLAMMEELAHALAEAENRADVSAIILSGQGASFSAGVDVAAHAPNEVESMLVQFHAIIMALVNSRKVTLSAVQGNCLGGGAELAMVCDMVYTANSSRWGFPEITLGCFPPVACAALAALVGQKKAAELILTGRTVDGREAAAIGLANYAVADEQLQAAVDRTSSEIGALSRSTLAITKKALYAWDSMHFDKGLARAEKIYREELINTNDAREGMEAFLHKRAPRWTGK